MNTAVSPGLIPAHQEDDQKRQHRPSFSNELRRGDSLHVGMAYIHEIRVNRDVPEGQSPHVFVSLGVQNGYRKVDEEKSEPVYQSVDVLAGRTCARSLMLLEGTWTKENGKLYGLAQIRNLVFRVETNSSGTFLENRGILETFQFGYLDNPGA